ncbi:MAG: flagella synthesis protein FlgN [Burkholderiaceae bacterium]
MTAPASRIATLLAQELALADTLRSLLERERECLGLGDVEGVSAIATEKATAVAGLAALGEERQACLAAAGIGADAGAVNDWIVATGGDVEATWCALLALASEAREANRVNGLLIQRHLSRNRTALNVLHGATQTGLYGPDGQSTLHKPLRGVIAG